MHTQFSEWHSPLRLPGSELRLPEWWQGVLALASSPDPSSIVELLRVAAGFGPSADDKGETIWEVLLREDEKLTRESTLHLRILCGASLVALFDDAGELAPLAALGAVSSSFHPSAAEVPGGPPFVDAAHAYLQVAAGDLRSTESTSLPSILSIEDQVEEIKTAVTGNTLPQVEPHLSTALATINKGLSQVASGLKKVQEETVHALTVRSEESDILWWAIGSYSRDLDRPFAGLDLGCAAIVAANELYGLTAFEVGPESTEGLLHQILSRCEADVTKDVALQGAVDSVPRQWRTDVVGDRPSNAVDPLLPVHCAISESVHVPAGSDWGPGLSARTTLTSILEVPAIALAKQFYIERLFLETIAGAT